MICTSFVSDSYRAGYQTVSQARPPARTQYKPFYGRLVPLLAHVIAVTVHRTDPSHAAEHCVPKTRFDVGPARCFACGSSFVKSDNIDASIDALL